MHIADFNEKKHIWLVNIKSTSNLQILPHGWPDYFRMAGLIISTYPSECEVLP